MGVLDTTLDTTLAGYTRLGFSARGLSVTERFPELDGLHVMVTGATGGIGRAAVERFADNGAVVHAVGRNREKLDELAAATDGDVRTWQADLSSMEQVADLARRFVEAGHPLHGLVNNVGVMVHDRTVTEEGIELTYATNLLGQYVLTNLLLPTLEGSEPARVVLVSSGGMYSQPLTVSNIDSVHGEYSGTTAYARTKRGQVVLAEEWARELASRGVVVHSMHPGWADTAGVKTSLPTFRRITGPFLRDEAEGADTIVWLIASQQADRESGSFWHDRVARGTHRMKRTVEDPDKRSRFMDRLASDAAPWIE